MVTKEKLFFLVSRHITGSFKYHPCRKKIKKNLKKFQSFVEKMEFEFT